MRQAVGPVTVSARIGFWIGLAWIATAKVRAEMVTVCAADLPIGFVDQASVPGVKIQRHAYSDHQPPAPVPPTINESYTSTAVGRMPGNLTGPKVFGDNYVSGENVAAFGGYSYLREAREAQNREAQNRDILLFLRGSKWGCVTGTFYFFWGGSKQGHSTFFAGGA